MCVDVCRSHGGHPVKICGRTEAAHLGRTNGMRSKGPDSGCAPIGMGHHRELHRIGAKDFEKKYSIDLRQRAAEFYELYLTWKERNLGGAE